MNIKNEIMEEWEDSFIASDEEQTHDAYPYNIKPFIHEEVTKFLSQALTRVEEAAREEEVDKIGRIIFKLCFEDINNRIIAERILELLEERKEDIAAKTASLSPSEEKEFVSDTNVTSKEEEECICKECQNGEICEACEDFGHQSPKKEKRGR